MAAVAVPPMAMGNSLDALNPPSGLTARRQATANLPEFQLPPVQFGAHRFPPLPNPSAMQPALSSMQNLMTPPSNSASDSVSPISAGMNNGNTSMNQGVLPYTPTFWHSGTTPSGYHTGFTPTWPGPNTSFRPAFSPSLVSLTRNNNNSSTTGESQSLPPPPYDLNPLPPFQNQASMSGSSHVPTTAAQQQQANMMNAIMNPPNGVSGPTQLSPISAVDSMNQKAPPSHSMYNGSHSSSTPQQSSYPYAGPSPVQQSPHLGHPSTTRSPSIGQGPMGQDQNQGPFVRPPYPSYTLPAMPGPVMTNVHSPGAQMSMVGHIPQGMIPQGYNSAYAANAQQMYQGGAPPQAAQPSPNDRPFKCDQCPQSFNRNHDLKRHKRIHLAVKPFPCGHCDKSFSRKDALKRHILVKGCGDRKRVDADSNKDEDSNVKSESGSDDSQQSPVMNGHH